MEPIPAESEVVSYVAGAYFSDCFTSVTRYENQSALDVFLSVANNSPEWINSLMSLRNKIVSKFGLKNLGLLSDIDPSKAANDYKVGDRVGIFTLHFHSQNEVILEDCDKHLNVKVSFYIEPTGSQVKVYASTVVHIKNTLGKLNMFFITPMHKLIVPATLKMLPPA